MTRRTVSVAALQLRAHDREAFASVWPDICDTVRRAAAAGARLAVLPEGTVPGYVIGNVPLDSSVTERALADIQHIAQRENIVVVYGSARLEGGLLYNSAFVVDSDGTLAGTADKTFLWHFDRQWFARGNVCAPIATSVGKLGVMICADGRIPTIARALAGAGADVLVMPTAWVTSGRDEAQFENVQADLLAQVRARENGMPFVAANKAGIERGCVAYCGKSQIVDAHGEFLALASQRDAEILSASIELGAAAPHRAAQSDTPRKPPQSVPHRIAITPFANRIDPEMFAILEADVAITGSAREDADAFASLAGATARDETVLDPGGLVPFKLAGYELIVWRVEREDATWLRRLARARALELRMYVVCIVEGREAFAVDPDGAVVCGTFGDFRVASFSFAPERTRQTLVAPSTDIMEGLEKAHHVGL